MEMIDKDALVAEIKERIKTYNKGYANGDDRRADALEVLLHDIDTLEVKEVDLEKEFTNYAKDILACDVQFEPFTHLYNCAKHFFELGLKAQKEPVSEDLGEYVNELSKQFPEVSFAKLSRIAVRVAKWQKEYLWKPADGDDLPEIDKEVIVLIKYDAQVNIHEEEYPTYRVGFGHRPNPDGWDAVSIITEKKQHYIPKTYGKGGWNIPDVKYWLDVELPKK